MITHDERSHTLTLHTRRTTYQMKVDEYRALLHCYYGPRVGEGDLSYLIQYADRGFSPNPNEAGHRRDYSLDTLPQEYSGCGVGDFRLPAAEVELPDGSRLLDLRYAGHEIRQGKYALPGLPAFHGEGGETLSVRLRDAASGVEVELLYGVFEDFDLITRAARITNGGAAAVSLCRAMSLCLDFSRADLDLITFDGGHAQERNLNRAPLRPGVQGVGSTRGMSSHQHNPFVILCERDAGEDHGLCYGAALLYSGDFLAEAERSQFDDTRLILGIHSRNFRWPLAPGESFSTPETALACSPDGLARLTHCLHRAVRERLIRDPYRGRRRPLRRGPVYPAAAPGGLRCQPDCLRPPGALLHPPLSPLPRPHHLLRAAPAAQLAQLPKMPGTAPGPKTRNRALPPPPPISRNFSSPIP